jgi:hypothetical protein
MIRRVDFRSRDEMVRPPTRLRNERPTRIDSIMPGVRDSGTP